MLGADRLIWGTDLTMDTGWAKLRYLRGLGCSEREVDLITHRNAQRIFPPGIFDAGR
jgi:predicted TIM-barrel fold metal-dependent hydrolase